METDPLDTLLDRWRRPPEPPSNLGQEVWRRIARNEEATTGWRMRIEALYSRPSFVLALVAACLATGFLISEFRLFRAPMENSQELARRYRTLIDPTFGESNTDRTREQRGEPLDWMKVELQLTEAQFERIKAIHERSSPHLVALAGQVTRLRDELAAFERERRTEGSIDFLAFARWADTQRSVDRECSASTRRLVLATADVMNEAQRIRYLGLLGPLPGDKNILH